MTTRPTDIRARRRTHEQEAFSAPGLMSYKDVLTNWKADFDYMRSHTPADASGAVLIYTFHPLVSGQWLPPAALPLRRGSLRFACHFSESIAHWRAPRVSSPAH